MGWLARGGAEASSRSWLRKGLRSRGRPRTGPIGFELSYEKLHMVQMDFGEDGPRIRAAASLDYPCPREVLIGDAGALKRLVKAGFSNKPFSGRRVVTTMPAGAVKLMLVTYSAPDDASEPQMVLQRSLERLDGDAADWVVDYLPVQTRRDREGDRAALVACTRRTQVTEYLDHLHRAGLQVDAVEVGPVAVRRLVASLSEANATENVLTINFGRARSYLTVYAGGTIALDREVSFGEDELAAKVAASLEMPLEEATGLLYRYGIGRASEQSVPGLPHEIASTVTEIVSPRFVGLVAEVEKAMMYTASQLRGAGIDGVYLLGSVARWPGAETLLGELLAIPVHVLNPFSAFIARSDAAVLGDLDPIAGISLATGCALRGGGSS